MELIFLGTNGWFDTRTGNTVCALIRTRKYDVVLDAGNGLAKLDRYCDGSRPVYLFLSHFHLDHIVGLHAILKFRLRGLVICGPKGARHLLKTFVNSPFTMPLDLLPYPVKIIELPRGARELPFKVECLPLVHADPVLGFRMRLDGKTLAYCTDTGWCPNALRLAKDADLLISECSNLPGEDNPAWPHFNPETAAKLAVATGARRLAMTHFSAEKYSSMRLRAKALRVARKVFPRAIAAKDGMRIKF